MRQAAVPHTLRQALDSGARGVTLAIVCELLGVSDEKWRQLKPRLEAAGFPGRDPITGLYDLKAVQGWMDRRHDQAEAQQGGEQWLARLKERAA